jgi:UDP-N-acetylmuramyl tripeptide synthase
LRIGFLSAATSAPIASGIVGSWAGQQVAPRLSRWCGRAVSTTSRLLGFGDGAVLGGMVAQRISPDIGPRIADPMDVIVVSGTNGKTTTCRMISDALAEMGRVAANRTGANLKNGVVGALIACPKAERAVLEVDEAVVGWALETIHPRVLVLLNLSRDQLDRMHEVQAVAAAWRFAIESFPPAAIVANADDPLIVWATADRHVTWVSAGLPWTADAATCMWCGGSVRFPPSGWCCDGCGRSRPGKIVADLDVDLGLELPGRSARANAVMALATLGVVGVPEEQAVESVRRIRSIEGRYEVLDYRGSQLRLLLAKNPAGWNDTLDLISGDQNPVILALNSGAQDGRDPSWIWDVPFELLQGRQVICMGERSSDLAVRITYADVPTVSVPSLERAVELIDGRPTHVIANYTAFQQLRKAVARGH